LSPRSNSQKGSALIFVTIVGMVMSLAFALFMTSTVLTEQRAVEAELARSRAYWAELGDLRYTMSRISYSRLCNSCSLSDNEDTDLATVL
jgi:type II secretory pathway component PulK